MLLFLSSLLAAARVEAWLEGLLLRLDLAGPAGYLKNALSRPSRVLFCRLCLTSQEKNKTGMERRGPTPSAFRRAGLRLALTAAGLPLDMFTCWFVSVRSLGLSPPMLSTPLAADFGHGSEVRRSLGRVRS